jgi:hypothetical protein
MIRLAIAIVVLDVCFLVARWIIIRPPIEVFLASLPPKELWLGVLNGLTAASHQALPWILAPLAVLYFIYKLVAKIKLIGKILLRIPPFPDIKRSGIISLFDAIFGIVFGRGSIKDRLKNFARKILEFIESSFTNSVNAVDDVFHIKNKLNALNPKLKIPDSISVSNNKMFDTSASYKEPKKFDLISSYNKNDEVTDADQIDSPLMTEEQKEINDKYQMCVYENTIKITPDITDPEEIKFINNQNSMTQTKCKIDKFRTSLSFVTNKYLQ